MRGMMMVWLEGRPLVRPQSHTPTPLIRRLPEGGAGGNVGKRVSSGYNRLRRLAPRSSGKQQVERTAVRAAPIVCPEESPQCARSRIPLPPAGIDAPTPARGQGLQPYGALDCFGGDPKGCRGERREARAQWAQPPKAVSDPEFRQTTSGAHGSAGRADCLLRGKPPACMKRDNFVAKNSPWRGMTRRLRRGRRACSPMGRSHFSFGGERKVCKRKPAARRLREKGFYCPF